MSPDNPFLQALLADPDDDTLRLAMADWLDENDQPERAEFVRVQIELARGVADRERRIALEVRQRDLLIAHEAEWVRPLADVLRCKPGEWGGWVFRRGFVEYFHLPATAINLHGWKLARRTPVRELYLRPCEAGDIVTLCKQSWIRSVNALYLRSARLDSVDIQALVDCPFLTGIRTIDVPLPENLSAATFAAFNAKFSPAF